MSEPEFDFDKINFGAGPASDPMPKNPSVKKTTARPVGRPTKDSKIKEIQAEIESIMKLAFLPMLMRDVHIIDHGPDGIEYYSCANVYVAFDEKKGSILTPDGQRFASALAAIVIDSPFLMKILTMGDDFGKWIALLMAIQPFAMTVFQNHMVGRKNERENSVG